jgi:NitT/TauT family transport system substrate-binding protein
VCIALAPPAGAAQIAVAQYGNSVGGMPWVIALKKGFMKESGADVTEIIGSNGGSSEIHNMLSGDLPYADTSLVPALKAIESGADLRIVNETGQALSSFVWLVKNDSPIKTLQDIKGKTISFTTPLSSSQTLDYMLIDKAGLKADDVKLVSTGAFGAALTALENNGVDIALVAEPLYTLNKGKYRVLFWERDIMPGIANTVGVTSAKVLKEHPDFLRGVIEGHRKAVEFMKTNRKESAQLIAEVYRMDPAIVEDVLNQIIDHNSTDGLPYFGLGDFSPQGLDTIVNISAKMGILSKDSDWRAHVDQSVLPDDLKRPLK